MLLDCDNETRVIGDIVAALRSPLAAHVARLLEPLAASASTTVVAPTPTSKSGANNNNTNNTSSSKHVGERLPRVLRAASVNVRDVDLLRVASSVYYPTLVAYMLCLFCLFV